VHTGADKSLARPGRKQANVYFRIASISFGPLQEKKLHDSSRLDVVEIARELVSFLVGLRTYQHPDMYVFCSL
jgi:hypothetical protein